MKKIIRPLSAIASTIAVMIVSACSSSYAQETAIRIDALDDSAWDYAQWISAPDAPVVQHLVTDKNFQAADGASWFVSEITNRSKVLSAKWMTTGLGVYDIYINGVLVGDEVLKPGFTDAQKTKYSFTYDVTELFRTRKAARNHLSAQVTPGWWGDKVVTPGNKLGMVGKKCAFRSVLELTYVDGSKEYFGTDVENWKAGIAGPVTHAAIFDGEYYDARIAQGYESPEKLSMPEINSEFSGNIFPSDGAEVYLRKDLSLSPVQIYKWKDVEAATAGEYGKVVKTKEYSNGQLITLEPGETLVVDFGQNAAAVPSFVFKAEEGTVLSCLPGELLNDGNGAKSRGMDGPEGSVHRLNLRIPEKGMVLQYTFSDDGGYVSYSPRRTFFGYRYVSLTASARVKIKSISSVPVSSITAKMETGSIVTGNELVNKLISNTQWGMLSNYLSVPTDCPQRNERLGWTADTQVFAETGSFFANTESFFYKWLRDLRDTQSDKGGFPGVAPKAQYGAEQTSMMRLGWADAGIIVPWTIWKQFGNTEVIEQNWEVMMRFIDHIARTKYDHNALKAENGNYQWGDWLSYEPLESHGEGAFALNMLGVKVPKPEAVEYWSYLGASYWAIDAAMMRDMAKASGRDPQPFISMVDEAKDYIRSRFLKADGSFKTEIFNTMQTPALFALKNNLLEGEAKENMIKRLRANFKEHGDCLQTGFLGTSILMSTLSENGMVDIAYELLFQRKNPSWLYSIDNGATTIWERWNSYTLEHGMGPKGMNSFNHYAYGCVCEWIWETAAGISADPAEPGFRHIILKPVPDKRLGYIDAVYNSAAGCIKSSWRYEEDEWIWEFTVPEGSRASVTLPGETEAVEYGPGSYTIVENYPKLPPMPEVAQAKPVNSVKMGSIEDFEEVQLDIPIAEGPFQPDWESIEANYPGTPEWLREAKFGFWVHFGPQSAGESGDWYARNLYKPGHRAYDNHLKRYGHPSEFGYKDVLNQWNPEKLDPEKLTELYRKAGARFLLIQGVHHDNYDMWNSRYHPWNSVNIGPRRDLLREWVEACEKNDMRYGVAFHHEYTWWWWQTAFGSDKTGEKAGIPYDGHLSLEDGKGKWWEGYDPRLLYGIDLREYESVEEKMFTGWSPPDPGIFSGHLDYAQWYATQWALRIMDVVAHYDPDFIYTDGTVQGPFTGDGTGTGYKSNAMQTVMADYYNRALADHGEVDKISIIKFRSPTNGAMTTEEFNFPDDINTSQPWMRDLALGDWFYSPGFIYDSASVIRSVIESISRDGCIAINICFRPDGSLEEPAVAMLEKVGEWMSVNGEAVYGSKAWKIPGEGEMVNGKLKKLPGGALRKGQAEFEFDAQDIRFTESKDGSVYAFCMDLPQAGQVLKIKSMGRASGLIGDIGKVSLLGYKGKIQWTQTEEALEITCPDKTPSETSIVFKINN